MPYRDVEAGLESTRISGSVAVLTREQSFEEHTLVPTFALAPEELALVERMGVFPREILWTLLLVGGELPVLDRFLHLLSVPIESLAEHESVPDEVRNAIIDGDVPVRRRFVLALLLDWQRWGKHARSTEMGAILTNAVMGRIERQLPCLRDDVHRYFERNLEAKTTAVRLLGPALLAPTDVPAAERADVEDTRRYFAFLDPWWVRLWRAIRGCLAA